MFKKILLSAALTVGFATGAFAEGGQVHDVDFSFEGPFGRFDEHQLQRGLQVFTDVCSGCHGIQYVYYRNLADEGGLGWTEDQMKAYTAQVEVFDPELADGDGDWRTAIPADQFPANTGAGAPDLSLMAKARAGFSGPNGLGMNQLFKGLGGPEYIVAILSGYEDPPSCTPEDFPGSYNTAFVPGGYPDECKDEDGHHTVPGSWIAMDQPLAGEDVDYADGHENDIHHEAMDVAAFLMWTAEPKMMARKKAASVWVGFLILLTVLMYLTNKKIWAKAKRKD